MCVHSYLTVKNYFLMQGFIWYKFHGGPLSESCVIKMSYVSTCHHQKSGSRKCIKKALGKQQSCPLSVAIWNFWFQSFEIGIWDSTSVDIGILIKQLWNSDFCILGNWSWNKNLPVSIHDQRLKHQRVELKLRCAIWPQLKLGFQWDFTPFEIGIWWFQDPPLYSLY